MSPTLPAKKTVLTVEDPYVDFGEDGLLAEALEEAGLAEDSSATICIEALGYDHQSPMRFAISGKHLAVFNNDVRINIGPLPNDIVRRLQQQSSIVLAQGYRDARPVFHRATQN